MVISISLENGQAARAASTTAATVSGSMSDGVPPPRKIERSTRPGTSRPIRAISASKARPQAPWSMRAATWLLKSQYGHLAWQNGQWT
jgi:hypothetical protein